jgi:flagellar assembly protein FliH
MALSSKLIKDSDAGGAQGLRAFSMRDIEDDRRRIIAAAEKDAVEVRKLAQEILAQAKTALARIRGQADGVMADSEKRGFEKGLAEGVPKGIEQGARDAREAERRRIAEETDGLAKRLEDITAAIEAERADQTARMHKDLVLFAIAVARKIVKREISISHDVIKDNLTRAIDLVAEKSELQVRLNPSELDVVEEYLPKLKSVFTKLHGVKLVSDMNVSPGGCIVRTRSGEVDASIETQLEEIERQLFEM